MSSGHDGDDPALVITVSWVPAVVADCHISVTADAEILLAVEAAEESRGVRLQPRLSRCQH